MNKFNMGGRSRQGTEFAGRPKSDANYGQKKRFDNDSRHEGGNRYNDRGPKEVQLFKATCTTCGKPCEVPFRPDGQKPVLCRDCFASKNSSPSGNNNFKTGNREVQARPSYNSDSRSESFHKVASTNAGPDLAQLHKQVATIESKLNEVLALLSNAVQEAKVAPTIEAKKETETKPAKPKKVAKKVAKKVTKK